MGQQAVAPPGVLGDERGEQAAYDDAGSLEDVGRPATPTAHADTFSPSVASGTAGRSFVDMRKQAPYDAATWRLVAHHRDDSSRVEVERAFMTASLRFMLLGIALILFGLALPEIENGLLLPFVYLLHPPRVAIYLIGAIFPLAGLVMALIGFFTRDR
jgi:hypothetical protein